MYAQGAPYRFDEGDPRWYCCCGNTHVRDGTKYIAWVSLILSIIMAIAFAVCLFVWTETDNYEINGQSLSDTWNKESQDTFETIRLIVVGVGLAMMAIGLIPTCCLLAGAYQDNKCLLLPWLIVTGISVCIRAIFLDIIGVLLSLWFMFVVYRYYSYLNERELGAHVGQGPAVAVVTMHHQPPPEYGGQPQYGGQAVVYPAQKV